MSLFAEIIRKAFNLPEPKCPACEVMRAQINWNDQTDIERHSVLQAQLDHALTREKELLDRLLQLTEPEVIPTQPVRVGNPVVKTRSFREAARIREEQDRIAANKIQKITDLEKELRLPGTEAEAKAEIELQEDKEFAAMAGIEDAKESYTA